MRRVLSVIPGPTFGGAATQAERLHRPLRALGWELVVVLAPDARPVIDRLTAAGLEVHVQPMHRLRASRAPGPHWALARHTLPETAALRRLVLGVGACVVQNHGDLNPQAGIAGHIEGAAVHWHLLDTRTPPALRRLTMPLVTRLSDSISTIGEVLADEHPGVRGLGERCVVVYPSVDAAAFAGARDRRAAARAELGVPDGALCVGAIGNRNPQKGHQWLVRAMARVRAQRPGAVVRILGAPSPGHEGYEAELRAEAAALGLRDDDGSFRIVDPGRRVPELIGAFDILCMPSVPNSEGLPTVLLEAMAAGVPVVATDVGAVREAVEPGRTGAVVPALDAEALAAALLAVAAAPQATVAAARARVLSDFSLDALAGRFDRAYALALEHRAGRRRTAAMQRFS
ncbi:MAG: hypothetical protein QOI80_96 [Solirubrobacteraceae bacterium]|nr:hypothetical protein [Solirubrobacteraceae bacterium]